MQYLSKAYNYYSGINPATLSGAIDIIVVRSKDKDGEETLACSPFHVRFGKLQVLRVGDKRVTLRLPNNLPPPHIAPFSMKVSDTGEAFFVIETEEPVPEDLLTSPVVMATDASEIPANPTIGSEGSQADEQPADLSHSLTRQPFGQTETQVKHEGHSELDGHLEDVEPLDLNASVGSQKAQNGYPQNKNKGEVHRHAPGDATPPSNPLEAEDGEDTSLPVRNYRLSILHDDESGIELPKVRKGENDGPHVQYGKDVVLDMGGYHRDNANSESQAIPYRPVSPEPKEGETIDDPRIEQFVNDLMSTTSSRPTAHGRSESLSKLPSSIAALSLDTPYGVIRRARSPSPERRRRREDRGQSEPPEDMRPSSPSLDPTQMDAAWDWGQSSAGVDDDREANRSSTLSTLEGLQGHPRATLKSSDVDPYEFVLEVEGRQHIFELAICDATEGFIDGAATDGERAEFEEKRISFTRFMQEPVVDDPRIVVLYDDMYLTWKTGYFLLFALAIYRRSFVQRQAAPPAPEEIPKRSSGYGWSRWWRRSELPNVPERPSSVQPKVGGSETPTSPTPLPVEQRPTSLPATVVPSRVGTPVPAPAPVAEQAETDVKHYAKTLRLSSDQLKELNLKPGPNTVQFSVQSSYSGYAVVTARIFLWEDTDQVIISDIDGTITKSDALGHVFAAIGRDWTHVGIARLYTDVCNNGYKMLYLTARAIGQADTTREYLKTIVQGDYRMPEGPVVMSPDRLMASLHREVILRKPELFKMACLRDIQRLFNDNAKTAFYAGFGNRITDAMSYRSVGIPSSKIYTIDTTGIIKTELLQSSHQGSYVGLNDLVNEVFPPVKSKSDPEFSDFNYWRDPIADIQLPDLTPPPASPALSARSDASARSGSLLGRIVGYSRASSPVRAGSGTASPRPSSPLIAPAFTAHDDSEEEGNGRGVPVPDHEIEHEWLSSSHASPSSSMPGSFDRGHAFPEEFERKFSRTDDDDIDAWDRRRRRDLSGSIDSELEARAPHPEEMFDEPIDGEDDDAFGNQDDFDDDIFATGEMARVPF